MWSSLYSQLPQTAETQLAAKVATLQSQVSTSSTSTLLLLEMKPPPAEGQSVQG